MRHKIYDWLKSKGSRPGPMYWQEAADIVSIKKDIASAPKDGTRILAYWKDRENAAMVYWAKEMSPRLGWAFANSGSFCRTDPDEWLEVPK